MAQWVYGYTYRCLLEWMTLVDGASLWVIAFLVFLLSSDRFHGIPFVPRIYKYCASLHQDRLPSLPSFSSLQFETRVSISSTSFGVIVKFSYPSLVIRMLSSILPTVVSNCNRAVNSVTVWPRLTGLHRHPSTYQARPNR